MSTLAISDGSEPPISRLSDDILHQIFVVCSRLWYDNVLELFEQQDNKKRSAVLAVCSRWRKVVVASQRYWSYIKIDETMSTDDVRTYIERSGSMPLHIRFCEHRGYALFRQATAEKDENEWPIDFDSEDFSSDDEDEPMDSITSPITAARAIATQSHRITALSIVGVHIFDLLRHIMGPFTDPAPELRVFEFFWLNFTRKPERNWRFMEVPFEDDAPLLQEFKSNDFFTPWGSYATPSLTSLSFHFLRSFGVFMPDLTAVLQCCPNLEVLDLNFDSVIMIKDALPDYSEYHVTLPHLRELKISSGYLNETQIFLSCLIYPPSTNVRLQLGYLKAFTLPITKTNTEATLDVQNGNFSLFAQPNVLIEGHPVGQHDQPLTALRLVSLPSLQSLTVSWTRGRSQWMNIMTELRRELVAVPSIKSLSIRYKSDVFLDQFNAKRICELMVTYPKLTSLSVTCIKYDPDDSLKKIADWLRARQAAHRGIGTDLRKLAIYAHLEYLVRPENIELPNLNNCDVEVKQCTACDTDARIVRERLAKVESLRKKNIPTIVIPIP